MKALDLHGYRRAWSHIEQQAARENERVGRDIPSLSVIENRNIVVTSAQSTHAASTMHLRNIEREILL